MHTTLCEYDSVLGSIPEQTEPIITTVRRGYVPQQLTRQMEQVSRSPSQNSIEREMKQFQEHSVLQVDYSPLQEIACLRPCCHFLEMISKLFQVNLNMLSTTGYFTIRRYAELADNQPIELPFTTFTWVEGISGQFSTHDRSLFKSY
jgi:hypothetical protein